MPAATSVQWPSSASPRRRKRAIWNARCFLRVAAPSIRFVPWAALASCWPLPQQLLPVSAAGGGRRRCILRIFSGKMIFNFGIPERLLTLRYPFFHGRGIKTNCICRACFLRKQSRCGQAFCGFQRTELKLLIVLPAKICYNKNTAQGR